MERVYSYNHGARMWQSGRAEQKTGRRRRPNHLPAHGRDATEHANNCCISSDKPLQRASASCTDDEWTAVTRERWSVQQCRPTTDDDYSPLRPQMCSLLPNDRPRHAQTYQLHPTDTPAHQYAIQQLRYER